MPRDVFRRAGLVALAPALFATVLVVRGEDSVFSRADGQVSLAGLLLLGVLFAIIWGWSLAGVMLLVPLGRWISPDGHMEHATHCDVCQSRERTAEGYSSKSSA